MVSMVPTIRQEMLLRICRSWSGFFIGRLWVYDASRVLGLRVSGFLVAGNNKPRVKEIFFIIG